MNQITRFFAQKSAQLICGNRSLLQLGQNFLTTVLGRPLSNTCDKCPKIKTVCPAKPRKVKCKLFADIKREQELMKEKKKLENKRVKSVWGEIPECCYNVCPIPPRFDELYYMPSDPRRRIYNKTWRDCIKLKPKIRCIYPEDNFLEPEIRPPKPRYRSCLELVKPNNLELMQCVKPYIGPCNPRLRLPGCIGIREPPKCYNSRLKVICEKIESPWPSFSECKKPALKKTRVRECGCNDVVSLCELIRYMTRNK